MTKAGAHETEAGGRAHGASIRIDIPPPVQPPVLIEDPERDWVMEVADLDTALETVERKLDSAEQRANDAAAEVEHWRKVLAALKAA
jgi:hypothetical protein